MKPYRWLMPAIRIHCHMVNYLLFNENRLGAQKTAEDSL